MPYLLDTNVVSELRKRERIHPQVRAWFLAQEDEDLYLSVITVAEIRDGIERLRGRDELQARRLERWLSQMQLDFGTRILPVTTAIADRWGQLRSPQPLPDFDRLLAATALEHDLVLVTRNIGDFVRTGTDVLNPWEHSA